MRALKGGTLRVKLQFPPIFKLYCLIKRDNKVPQWDMFLNTSSLKMTVGIRLTIRTIITIIIMITFLLRVLNISQQSTQGPLKTVNQKTLIKRREFADKLSKGLLKLPITIYG